MGCLTNVYTVWCGCARNHYLVVADFTSGCHNNNLRCSWRPRGGRYPNFTTKTLASLIMNTLHPMGLLYLAFFIFGCFFFCLFLFHFMHITLMICTHQAAYIYSRTKFSQNQPHLFRPRKLWSQAQIMFLFCLISHEACLCNMFIATVNHIDETATLNNFGVIFNLFRDKWDGPHFSIIRKICSPLGLWQHRLFLIEM